MTGSEVLTIGSTIRHRGEYNSSTVYYFNNQVTMYGCVFQALNNNFSNIPPLTVASDKTIALANTSTWKCIINNVALYNATLSTNNIDSRVTTIENSIDTIKNTADAANTTAQAAKTSATTALNTANEAKQRVANAEQQIEDNMQRISENAEAIKALQNGASPLKVVCSTKTIAYEPDEKGCMALAIPIKIYDGGTDITDKVDVLIGLYTPSVGITTSWDGSVVKVSVSTPGKYELVVDATYQGKAAHATFEIYLTLPTTITIFDYDEETDVELSSETVTELPVKLSVTSKWKEASELLINIPSYLNASKITCCGIDVPVVKSEETKDNYSILCTQEEILPGTYDFIIQ